MIDTAIGLVFPTTHFYERADRHRIDLDYAEMLIEAADDWDFSGSRVTATVEDHGIVWKVVLDPEDDESMRHDWDLVTVAPEEVDIEEATANGWSEADALNLAVY